MAPGGDQTPVQSDPITARRQGTTPRTNHALRTPEAVFTPALRSPGKELGPRANRTIATILDATRQIFLTRGYGGTTIDEITKAAGISRASFYTYFPSKREVLLALGADGANAAYEVIRGLDDLPQRWKPTDVEAWVRRYFELLDDHGSFSFAWTQAAHEDEEIRRAGMARHLLLCRQLGEALARFGTRATGEPVEHGLLVFSMLERTWMYTRLYDGTMDEAVVHRSIVQLLTAAARRPTAPSRRA
jgi:TetR/AcrR family transcriptional regulator